MHFRNWLDSLTIFFGFLSNYITATAFSFFPQIFALLNCNCHDLLMGLSQC